MEHDFNKVAENCLLSAMGNIAQAMYYIRENDETWADHELNWELRRLYDYIDGFQLSDYNRCI